jgi:hypothetical protein
MNSQLSVELYCLKTPSLGFFLHRSTKIDRGDADSAYIVDRFFGFCSDVPNKRQSRVYCCYYKKLYTKTE